MCSPFFSFAHGFCLKIQSEGRGGWGGQSFFFFCVFDAVLLQLRHTQCVGCRNWEGACMISGEKFLQNVIQHASVQGTCHDSLSRGTISLLIKYNGGVWPLNLRLKLGT